MTATSPAQTPPLTGRIETGGITNRLWRIYIDGIDLRTYIDGFRSHPLPTNLVIGPSFWRHPEWESLPVALQCFIARIWASSVRHPWNDLQEIRVEAWLQYGWTRIWVKHRRGHDVTDEESDWYLELVSSMLGRPIHVRPFRQVEP